MVDQRLGRAAHGFDRRDSSVRPHFQNQPFVVGDLTDSSTLNVVVYLPNWAEDGIQRQNTHGQTIDSVTLDRLDVSHTLFHVELDGEMGAVRVQGR